MTQAIEVKGLTVHYDKVCVLWDINLTVPKGKLVGILGPNGAGKSTFIKAVLGIAEPVSGTVQLLGKPLSQVYGKIAYIPQKEAIDWDFPITMRDLVLMGRYPKRGLFQFITKEDQVAADKCIEMVGLEAFASRQISELSGGQQQRAFLARALLQDAEISFLDEPLSGVDHASEKIIMNILKEMKDRGKTIFIVHHDLNSVEEYFDWAVFINVHLIAAGPVHETFVKRTIYETYGKSFHLIDESLTLCSKKIKGI